LTTTEAPIAALKKDIIYETEQIGLQSLTDNYELIQVISKAELLT
jgi:hypothetical protein